MSYREPQLISFDYAMKYILRDKSDYTIIEGFLSDLLATANYKPVKIKAMLESESNKEDAWAKKTVADMIVEDADGVQYIIEIERNEKINFMHKACFATSRLIVDNIGQGQDYSGIVKVLHINLLYFDIGGGSVYHGKTIMHDIKSKERLHLHLKREDDGSEFDLVDILPEYFIISVPAFHDEINQGIDEWLYMMKHEEIKPDFKSQYIKKAAERLNYLKMTLEEKAKYNRYLLELVDAKESMKTAIARGKREGREEGIEEGLRQGIEQGLKQGIEQGAKQKELEFINNLKDSGMSVTAIAKLTKLTELEVERLLHKSVLN